MLKPSVKGSPSSRPHAQKPLLIVDATGQERPVLEFFTERNTTYQLVPTEITTGTKRTIASNTGHAHLAKAMLDTPRRGEGPRAVGISIRPGIHRSQRSQPARQ